MSTTAAASRHAEIWRSDMSSIEPSDRRLPGETGLPRFFSEGILLAHFIVSADVERSRRFYTDVLGGVTVQAGEPTYVALANGWIIINGGGGPTEDKPTVTLEPPGEP